MTVTRRGFVSMLAMMPLSGAFAESVPTAEKLGIDPQIEFDGKFYQLAWGQQKAGYVKQEYLPQGQSLRSFTDMIIIEFLTNGTKMSDAVNAQVNMLEQRKDSDPVVNFQLHDNKDAGEFLLDFVMSDNSTGALVVEWSAYRYVPVDMPDGKTGVSLFALVHRYTGDNPGPFFKALKANRLKDIAKLAQYDIPDLRAATP